jgi:hypothetical protein
MHEGTDENNKRKTNYTWCRLQWSRSPRFGSAAAQLLGFGGRIPPGHGCLSLVSKCVVRQNSLRLWADHSSGGVPTSEVFLSVVKKSR